MVAKTTKPKTPTSKNNQQLEDKLKRALADYSNLEKRFAKESAHVIKFANAPLIRQLLELKDNLELAAANIQDEGINMVLNQLTSLLTNEAVAEIQTKGLSFDVKTMECEEAVPGKKDNVIEVIKKGYTLHDRVLRPVKVKVGNGITKNK